VFTGISFLFEIQQLRKKNSTVCCIWSFIHVCSSSSLVSLWICLLLFCCVLIQRWVQSENSEIYCSQSWLVILQTRHTV